MEYGSSDCLELIEGICGPDFGDPAATRRMINFSTTSVTKGSLSATTFVGTELEGLIVVCCSSTCHAVTDVHMKLAAWWIAPSLLRTRAESTRERYITVLRAHPDCCHGRPQRKCSWADRNSNWFENKGSRNNIHKASQHGITKNNNDNVMSEVVTVYSSSSLFFVCHSRLRPHPYHLIGISFLISALLAPLVSAPLLEHQPPPQMRKDRLPGASSWEWAFSF